MLTDPSRIRVVLFDAVGTVIHAQPSVVDVYARHGRVFGSCVDRATIRARLRTALLPDSPDTSATSEEREFVRWQSIVCEVFDDVPDAGEGLFQTLWNHFADPQHWRVYDDVHATWRQVEQQGMTVGVASNFDGRLVHLCEQLTPLCRSDHLFYSSRVGFSKPCRHFFHHVQGVLDVPADTILLVGDDVVNDLQGAVEAGWQSVLIDREGIIDQPAIKSLTELLSIVS